MPKTKEMAYKRMLKSIICAVEMEDEAYLYFLIGEAKELVKNARHT